MKSSESKIKWLWLSLFCHMSKSKMIKLYDFFGCIDNIFSAQREDYEKLSFLKGDDIDRLCVKDTSEAENHLSLLEKNGISVITCDDELYPSQLFDISGFPSVLYAKGKIRKLEKNECISIVGSRTPQSYGKNITSELAYSLAKEGLTVVSGMADGIDSLSHRGALDAKGFTVAVLGCGVDVIYPKGNFELYEKIADSGMIISEYPPGTRPEKFYFPERNKIVAALSLATLVTEANTKSGSLITCDCARKYKRHIFAVPGNITSTLSGGTNELIRDGASVVTGAKDILDFYGIDTDAPKKDKKDGLSEKEALVYEALSKKDLTIDEIHYETLISLSELNSMLLIMELKNIIKKTGADKYTVCLK